jgi:hypothetical protein
MKLKESGAVCKLSKNCTYAISGVGLYESLFSLAPDIHFKLSHILSLLPRKKVNQLYAILCLVLLFATLSI